MQNRSRNPFSPLVFFLALAVAAVVSGCSGGNHDSASTSAPSVSSDALLANPVAMQSVKDKCDKLPVGTHSKDCDSLDVAQSEVMPQYREAVSLVTDAESALSQRYAVSGKWAASNAEAGIHAPTDVSYDGMQRKYVKSVTIGPNPGVITVKWGAGVLAGKQLVLTPPAKPGAVCWNTDEAATTVEKVYRVYRIGNGCQ